MRVLFQLSPDAASAPAPDAGASLHFTVNGAEVEVVDDGATLLEVLRDRLGITSPKDGCSPQGQCGCCTVWVDGSPRVACVTPARRVAGRSVTTLEGLDDPVRRRWVDAILSAGASQCGFCTPGIIMRLAGLEQRRDAVDEAAIERSLLAHLCRCTGWRTIVDAALAATGIDGAGFDATAPRDWESAGRRATLEGGSPQRVGGAVVVGEGGFADDVAPVGSLVAVPDGAGGFAVAPTLSEARRRAGKVQGRRSTAGPRHPVPVPDGDWELTLQTTWVEPAYLETDGSWCLPGGTPADSLANGGAFGGKASSPVGAEARRLADEHGQAVRVLWSREDVVRDGPKRPPVAAAIRLDGTGVIRIASSQRCRTSTDLPATGARAGHGATAREGDAGPGCAGPGGAGPGCHFDDEARRAVEAAIGTVAPGLAVEWFAVDGPPLSTAVRGAGWVEAAVVAAALSLRDGGLDGWASVTSPSGGVAKARVTAERVEVVVHPGPVLDAVVLRSYCIGAAHMAVSWVLSEYLAVSGEGEVQDLTIRSFGVLTAGRTPRVAVKIVPGDGEPVAASDAVFAAVAAAAWAHAGFVPAWPVAP